MHYGNRFTMVLGGLIDHAQGKHLFLHPQPFWPKDANLVISTLFHHICTCILSCTVPHSRPSTLYLQADNCAGENKNIYMLTFLSPLISLDMFQEIYLSFLLVGHTHEDIDQLFSMVQMKFHTSTIHTPGYALPLAICGPSECMLVFVNSSQCASGILFFPPLLIPTPLQKTAHLSAACLLDNCPCS